LSRNNQLFIKRKAGGLGFWLSCAKSTEFCRKSEFNLAISTH